jgi:hypothetical protein
MDAEWPNQPTGNRVGDGAMPADYHRARRGRRVLPLSSAFRDGVNSGLRLMAEYPNSILVVGAEARHPEVEYGWIEPGRTVVDSPANPLRRVSRFWGKPDLARRNPGRRGMSLEHVRNDWSGGGIMETLQVTVPELTSGWVKFRTTANWERFTTSSRRIDFFKSVLAQMPGWLLGFAGFRVGMD